MSFTWMALMAHGNRKPNCWPAMRNPWIASVEPLTSRTRPSLGGKNQRSKRKKRSASKFSGWMNIKIYDYLHLKLHKIY